MTWRMLSLPLLVAAFIANPIVSGATAQQAGAAGTDTAAIGQFDAAIAKYMALRKRLVEEVPGPIPASTAAKLTQASDALAAAIQRSRPKAHAGDLFVPPAATMIKHRVADLVRKENLGPVLATIDDEEQGPKTPSIHMRFPAAAPMATMPPSLLAALPKLPKELEYRIIGQYLILRDVDAALILDVIPAAIPR